MIALWFACATPTEFRFQDANNYAFSSELSASVTVIPPATDAVVDWSGLDLDFLGEALDPATDVSTVMVVRFAELTEEEVLRGINEDDLPAENVFGFEYAPGGTSARMSEFDLSGTYLDPGELLVEDGGAYLVSVRSGYRYRMIELFRPVSGAEDVPVVIDRDSADIAFAVDLDAGEPLVVPGGTAELRFDWADLTRNGSGRPIDLPNVDRLVLARFDATPEELASEFLHFDELAVERYEVDVSGFGSAELGRATASDGAAFAGFDDGTWYAALLCSFCVNPAPVFLTRVQVN
jgi:hypothetical protein